MPDQRLGAGEGVGRRVVEPRGPERVRVLAVERPTVSVFEEVVVEDRGARRGMGPRPPSRKTIQSPSRSFRHRHAAVRDVRQDLQGPDGRDARVADPRIPGTRIASRCSDRLCPARVGRRDCVQRSASQPPLCGRSGAQVGARERFRADKRVEDADTMETVRKIFAAQG